MILKLFTRRQKYGLTLIYKQVREQIQEQI